jgi:hypothetical protein
MGPFERVVAALKPRIRELPVEARSALFLGASLGLSESWREWSAAAGLDPAADVYDRAVAAASAFASGGEPVSRDLLEEVEASTPSEPSDRPGFIATQDCWICLDVALRASSGERDPADYAWYLLEPMFQAVSLRLFGFTDVGSIDQEECDSASLADPAPVDAIAAIEQGIAMVASAAAHGPRFDELRLVMAAIRP